MKHRPSIAPTTVIHDCLLLTAPQLNAPALTWIPAGTMLQPLAVQHGFFTIVYQQQRGFFPVAVCTPLADPASTALRFTHPVRAYVQPWPDTSITPLAIISADIPMLRLGHEQTWVLIQWSNGRLGFIATQAAWNTPPPSCITVLAGYFLGLGWLAANWFAMLQLTASIIRSASGWSMVLNALLGVAVPIVCLTRARSDFALLFSIGALTIGVIAGVTSIALAFR